MAQHVKARPGTAGLLVLVATTGALLAFGWRAGDPARAFRNTGRMLLQSREFPGSAIPAVITTVGFAHHLIAALLWGMLLMLFVRGFRGWALVAASLVVSAGFGLLNLWLIPPAFGVGYSVVTSLARVIPLALAIAVALLVTPWASGVPEQRPTPAPFA